MSPRGWEDIRGEVLRRIRLRDWAPGALIPGEAALAAEFGVARATVNRALRELAQSGVLERKRKAGTRVAALPVRKAVLDIQVIRVGVEAAGKIYGCRVLSRRHATLPDDLSHKIGVATALPMLWIETLHLADAAPFAHEIRWLNPAVLPMPLPDEPEISVNEWLVKNVSYATGDIEFSAKSATAHEASVLQVATGSALFVTERRTWTAEALITWVRIAHAPGYHLNTAL